MGCWNKTCGLSNLHITSGEPVYVFVLERNRNYDPCYSTGLFTPLLLPFESEYDDYGGGENDCGAGLDLIMEGLKERLIEMEVGENKYHDIEVKREGFGPKNFFEAVHEDRLRIGGQFDQEPTQVYFTMMRKDIVDHILETRQIEEYVGGNKGTIAKWGDSKDYIRYKFANVVASVRPLLEKMIEDSKDQQGYIKSFMAERLYSYRSQFPSAAWLGLDGYRYSRIVDVRSLINDAVGLGTEEAVSALEPILVEYLKGAYIDGFMHAARKSWIPGGHEGSQSSSGGALRLLGDAITKALDNERAKWMSENEGDEDEYLYAED